MLVKKERIPVLHILLVGLLPSFLKIIYYRSKGYKIGKGVSISPGAVVIGKHVIIGDDVKIGFFTIIRGKTITINRYVKIGALSVIDTEKIFIDEDARINEQVYIGGMKTPQSEIRLGKRTTIMQLSYLNPTLPIIIGDDSGIGGHCLLFTHGSWNDQLKGFPVKFAPITIGKSVWLPWRVFIMPGVTMGDDIVIGANSLITSDIPSNSLVAGNPAKILKENYPAKPSGEHQNAMLEKLFTDFFEYISYHGFEVIKSGTSTEFSAVLNKNNVVSSIIYSLSGSVVGMPAHIDNVLIIFNQNREQLTQHYNKGWKMVLSPGSRLRIGRSNTGEEITAFFSRYGTRFDRID